MLARHFLQHQPQHGRRPLPLHRHPLLLRPPALPGLLQLRVLVLLPINSLKRPLAHLLHGRQLRHLQVDGLGLGLGRAAPA
jgi:hypothetical protein